MTYHWSWAAGIFGIDWEIQVGRQTRNRSSKRSWHGASRNRSSQRRHPEAPYGFKIEGDLIGKIEKLREALVKPRDEVLASRKDPETAERWLKAARNVRSKVKTALEDQNKDGVWTDDNEIEAGLFVKHLNAMSTYVNASAKAKLNP